MKYGQGDFVLTLQPRTKQYSLISVSGTGIKALVRGIENSIEPAFNIMVKKAWGTVEAVGDQSDYVNTIATTLQFSVGAVKQHFASNKYFRTFCDKFTE